MSIFHNDNVMDWYRKNQTRVFPTERYRRNAERTFDKCCFYSSQEQLLEYVMVDKHGLAPIAIEWMEKKTLQELERRRAEADEELTKDADA